MEAYTPLHEIPPPFSMMWNVPIEEFHLIKEGVGRPMVQRLFEKSNTNESRQIHAQWTAQYEAAKIFYEIPRCTRSIYTSKLKGAELGVLVMSAFPSLVHLLNNRKKDHW